MGKTSLALAVLHDTAVLGKFGHNRYFIACDAAEGDTSCLSIVCSCLGVASTNRKQLVAKLVDGPSRVVLDNFESAWEAPAVRAEAEAVLAALADISTLFIIVTLRGSERPAGVAWSQPMIPRLAPSTTSLLSRRSSRFQMHA